MKEPTMAIDLLAVPNVTTNAQTKVYLRNMKEPTLALNPLAAPFATTNAQTKVH